MVECTVEMCYLGSTYNIFEDIMSVTKWIVASTISLGLIGCERVNVSFDPSSGDSRFVDAQQRAVISIVRENSDGSKDVKVCAEPSPDALVATATALSGHGEAAGKAIEAAFSQSNSVASIGLRTQSIQLLRDAYYRVCEGYMNGGLDQVSFESLQRRYQNHMIAFLAVEQLTGATVAVQAKVDTTAKAEYEGALRRVSDAIAVARVEQNRLQILTLNTFDELQELNSKAATYETDSKQKAAADAEIKIVSERLEFLKGLGSLEEARISTLVQTYERLEKTGIDVDTSATAGFNSASTSSSTAHIAQIAGTVERITLAAMGQNYSIHTCVEALRKSGMESDKLMPDAVFLNFCKELMAEIVKNESKYAEASVHQSKALDHSFEKVAAAVAIALQRSDLTVQQANALASILSAMNDPTILSLAGSSVAGPENANVESPTR